MTETDKAKLRLIGLDALLDDLETNLDPLFSRSLSESLLALEPIQQAKLQTALPYIVYDLLFIYLKSVGVDPRSHPVVSELERVRQYFGKIKQAETPDTSRIAIDREAAGRFIKHAITQAKVQHTQADEPNDTGTTTLKVPVKVTSKMLLRAEYEKEMKERDVAEGSEEEDLKVFADARGDSDTEISNDKRSRQNPELPKVKKRTQTRHEHSEGSSPSSDLLKIDRKKKKKKSRKDQ